MAGRKVIGSSSLLEFLVALTIGGLAVVGALLCIGFLLVEPIRSPPSEAPTVDLADLLNNEGCQPLTSDTILPNGCTFSGRRTVTVTSCSQNECPCNQDLLLGTTLCCCRGIEERDLSRDISCILPNMAPQITTATRCVCSSCDDLQVTVTLTVVAMGNRNPIIAARVFRMDTNAELTFLGITNNVGVFRYREAANIGPLVLQVQAAGYIMQSTSPALPIDPSIPSVHREVMLMPSMDMEVGLGGAPLILRLGTMLSISADPRSFIDINGDVYEDVVYFSGNVFDIGDSSAMDTIPRASFEFSDPSTGVLQQFGLLVGMFLEFKDRSGQPLQNPEGIRVSVSVSTGGGSDVFSLVAYDPFLRVWNKTSDLSETQPFRKKRQDDGVNRSPVIFEGRLRRLAFFQAAVANRGVDCAFQTRVFDLDVAAPLPNNAVVTMRQSAFLLGIFVGDPILIQFIGETGQQQTEADGLESNALCLPVACFDIVESVLVASDAVTDTRLFPVDFSDTVFDATETAPIILSTAFLFTQVSVSTVNNSRPFYANLLTDCVEAGQSSMSEPSEHFTFREANDIELLSPDPNDACFIKILINDCFASNEVMITSIDRVSMVGVTTFFVVNETTPMTTPAMTTDVPTTDVPSTMGFTTDFTDGMDDETGSGTEPPTNMTETTTEEVTTPTTAEATTQGITEQPFCNAETSTVRGICLPYTCGDNIRVVVTPNPMSSIPPGSFCEVTSRSILLEQSPFLTSANQTDQLNVLSVANPDQGDLELELLFQDFNDPNLGLYTDAAIGGDSNMAGMAAEQRCNAGMGEEFMSPVIDLTQGYAAIFSCFEEDPNP